MDNAGGVKVDIDPDMTYEYRCAVCSYEWEEEQSINDDPVETCPKCGKKKAQRLVSGGIGIIFKGGGWTPKGK
jgi:putative FmdB family regulatory protein